MSKLENLKIKIFADGADLKSIEYFNDKPYIKGFTTNPTLMRKSGVNDYKKFATEVLNIVKSKPISFEVFSDEIKEMESQALEISSWGSNANVKIPISNSKGESTVDLIGRLSKQGVVCNVTAIFTIKQLKSVLNVLDNKASTILSIFAGRLADAGMDPIPVMKESVICQKTKPKTNILWAATREIINIFQAESLGCQIITVPYDIIKKFQNIGKSPENLSLETVSKFYSDAKEAKLSIKLENTKKK